MPRSTAYPKHALSTLTSECHWLTVHGTALEAVCWLEGHTTERTRQISESVESLLKTLDRLMSRPDEGPRP
jgi:hypothetical protein